MKPSNYLFVIFFMLVNLVFSEDISVKAMNIYEKQYEVLMNNVVNANTPGFKSTRVVTFGDNGDLVTDIVPDNTRGNMVYTGDELNLAIEGPGYFMVEGPQGMLYTRDGRLKVSQEMELITLIGGYRLQGESGPINLNPDAGGGINFSVSSGGLITQKDNVIDRLIVGEIMDYSKVDLIKGAFFKPKTSITRKPGERENASAGEDVFQPLELFKVRQGYYEASNVDMAKELVNMPLISKKYDANSKVLQIKRKARKSALEMGRPQ